MSAATAALLLRHAFVGLALAGVLTGSAAGQVFRDANCDGTADEADRAAVVDGLFSDPPPACAGADANRDGARSAADLIALALGPRITFIGIASADGRPASPLGVLPDGAPVYFRNSGFGFLLVVEAAPGPSGAPVGQSLFDSVAGDPAHRPDFQIVVDRRLGDGSRTICDEFGVPGTDAADFAVTQQVSDTINDLACRFSVATTRNGTCTQDAFGQPGFVVGASRAQFCLPVTALMAFSTAETGITVQLRDESGMVGPRQRMVLQVQSGPPPPTFTPIPATPTRTATPTASATATDTPTVTQTPTQTASVTRTSTRTPTITRTPSRTATPPSTPTASATGTRTRTHTPGPTNTRTATGAATATPTRTGTRTATRTPTTPSTGPTGTRTRTPTASPSIGPSRSPTRTRTITPTPTPTSSASGPVITFLGLTRADDVLIEPSGMQGNIPIYQPQFGASFSIVVEGKPGSSRFQVAKSTYNPFSAPDLRIQVNRALGDGSAAVCDDMPPILGGVPAVDPPVLGDNPATYDRMNDLACRFIDGQGNKVGRNCGNETACVLGLDGEFDCVKPDTSVQFCGFISQILGFAGGDTTISVQLTDVRGNLGPPAQIIVRVAQ